MCVCSTPVKYISRIYYIDIWLMKRVLCGRIEKKRKTVFAYIDSYTHAKFSISIHLSSERTQFNIHLCGCLIFLWIFIKFFSLILLYENNEIINHFSVYVCYKKKIIDKWFHFWLITIRSNFRVCIIVVFVCVCIVKETCFKNIFRYIVFIHT